MGLLFREIHIERLSVDIHPDNHQKKQRHLHVMSLLFFQKPLLFSSDDEFLKCP